MKKLSLLFFLFLSLSFSNIFAQTVKQIYWADAGASQFLKAGIDGSGVTTLWDGTAPEVKLAVTAGVDPFSPIDIDVDFTNGIVYGIDQNGRIFKCNLDGSGLVTVSTGISKCFGLALDRVNNKLYFSTYQDAGDIYTINTSLAGGTTAIIQNAGVYFYALAVDPVGGKIYFASGLGGPREPNSSIQKRPDSNVMNGFPQNSIIKADLDGSNWQSIVGSQSYVYGLDLDLTNNKIYWTNYSVPADAANKNTKEINIPAVGRISKCNLDGSNVTTIRNDLTGPFGISLDVTANKIYYSKYVQILAGPGLNITTKRSERELTVDPGQLISMDMDGNNLTLLFNVSNPCGLQVQTTIPTPPVNEPPFLDVNGGLTLDDGTTTTLTQSHLSAVDPDGSDPGVRYNVSQLPSHGTLLIVRGPNLKIEQNEINLTVFRQDDIDQGYVSYQHDGGISTSDSFTFTLDDGEGGTSPEYTFDITINQTNDPPALSNIEQDALVYTVGSGARAVTSTLVVTDTDNTNLASASVEIGQFITGEDVLSFTNTGAITHVFNSTSGVLELTGPATVAQFQAALRSVQYENLAGLQANGTEKLITYSVNDEIASSNLMSRLITIQLPSGEAPGLNAPTNIQITYNADGTITVTWDDNSGNELGFIVYRQSPSEGKLSVVYLFTEAGVVGQNSTSFIDENVIEGVAYSYKVAAYNEDGIAGGGDGDEITLTQTLIPPSDLSGSENAGEQVVLTWVDNSDMETGYKIERNDGTGFTEIGDVDAGVETYTDENATPGTSYTYRVYAYNATSQSSYSNTASVTVTNIDDLEGQIPTDYALYQNYPNPFNPSTLIRYALPEPGNVRLVVYDMLGRQVALLVNEYQGAGYNEIAFNANGLNSGIYIYRLTSGNFTEVKKMILIK